MTDGTLIAAQTTVAVPARNAARTIGRCLGHASALSRPPARLLVIDDHCTDETARIAAEAGAEVVPAGGRGGLGAARNTALAHCRTRYLAFLNADCYAASDWLERLAGAMHSSSAAIAGGMQLELRRGTLAERWKARHLRQDWGPAPLADPDYLSGGNLLLDTAATGLRFDERYEVAYEDVDFCRRARAAGLRLAYEPSAVVRHDHPETLRTLPAKVWSYGAASSSLGIRTRRDVVRGFVRMHLRPRDQVRDALRADWREARPALLLVGLYLLAASFFLFLASAAAPSWLRGAPATLRSNVEEPWTTSLE